MTKKNAPRPEALLKKVFPPMLATLVDAAPPDTSSGRTS